MFTIFTSWPWAKCVAGPKIVLCFPSLFICLFLVGLCVPTYRMRNNYVMYIVAMQLYFKYN